MALTDTLPRLPVRAGGRSRAGARPVWTVLVLVAAALIVIPVAMVAAGALVPTPSVWRMLWATSLPEMLVTTVALLLAVGVGTLLLGGGLAWLVTAYQFPGRAVLAWLLVLPLAMPGYVLGFVFLSLLTYTGPVQTAVRSVFGPGVWFPEVRSFGGAVIVLTLTLYPYVYLLARSALLEQVPDTFDAARTLGAGRIRVAWRVALPLARPSLAAGLALVMMETLTDFATVKYFNVQTVSLGVYQVWKGLFNREAASELAALVLVFALAVIAGERLLRGRTRFHQRGSTGRGLTPTRLAGGRGWAATAGCSTALAVAFVIPVAQLLAWSGADTVRGVAGSFDTRFITYSLNSLFIAAVAGLACVGIAIIVSHGSRLAGDRFTTTAAGLTTVGYAVPGVVVGIGVLVVFAELDAALEAIGVPGGTGLLVTGSVLGVCYAYVVRFLALAYSSVDASFAKVTPSMTASALTLGASPRRVLRRVHLPLVRSGVGVALVLVLIDALKELPIMLLLRPLGFNTLSVWVYRLATESRWAAAGLPALTIVAVALVPVVLLFRGGRGREGATP